MVDKSCKFIADASKTTGATNSFSVSQGDSTWLLRSELDTEYEKWIKDIGRAKMVSLGFSTSSPSRFASLFQKGSKSTQSLTSITNMTAKVKPEGQPAVIQQVAGAGTSNGGKELQQKINDIMRLEEQVARKRQEAMVIIAMMEGSGGLVDDNGVPVKASPKTGRPVSRLESYRSNLVAESHRKFSVVAEWSGHASNDLTLLPGDEVCCWYCYEGSGWGFGSCSRDGKDSSGWFPLAVTKAYEDAVSAAAAAEVKKLDLEGFAVKVFNMKAKKGIQWIKEQLLKGLSPLTDADVVIGNFLWEHRTELSKEELGNLFGEEGDEAQTIYKSFVSKFNVAGLDLDIALRRLLYLFKLPGEAQKIDRIMKGFSQHYFDSNCGENSPLLVVKEALKSPKETYTLVFALIMLNTDAHTENLPKRMSCQEFLDNIRYSTKEGIFIDNNYLTDMYWRIVNEEIKMQQDARFPFSSKKGYLELRMGPFWAKRWVVLDEGKLIICKSATHEDEVQLRVPVSSTVVSEEAEGLGILLATPVSKLRLRAKTERERGQWISALAKERERDVESESDTRSVDDSVSSSQRSDLFAGINRQLSEDFVSADQVLKQKSPSLEEYESKPVKSGRGPARVAKSASEISVMMPSSPNSPSSPSNTIGGAAEVVDADVEVINSPGSLPQRTPRSRGRPPKSPRSESVPGGLDTARRKKKTGTTKKARKKRRKVVALYDVVAPPSSSRISVTAGEVLLLVQRTNETWYKVQNHSGIVGFIPSSYIMTHVSGISSLEPPPQPLLPSEDFSRRPVDGQLSPTASPRALSPRTPRMTASPGTREKMEEEEEEDSEKDNISNFL